MLSIARVTNIPRSYRPEAGGPDRTGSMMLAMASLSMVLQPFLVQRRPWSRSILIRYAFDHRSIMNTDTYHIGSARQGQIYLNMRVSATTQNMDSPESRVPALACSSNVSGAEPTVNTSGGSGTVRAQAFQTVTLCCQRTDIGRFLQGFL